MLDIGDPAPDFDLPGGDGQRYRLADALERGPLILYFYPMDFTPTCTREACMFRDALPELQESGLEVWGVNSRHAESHAAFAEKHGLGFPLLVDEGRKVAKSYGALAPLGLYVRRVTYLISPGGRILDRSTGDLGVGPHRELVQRWIASQSAAGEG